MALDILLEGFSGQIIILSAVLAIQFIQSKFIVLQPFKLFTFYCQQLAKKVNKPSHTSQQLFISGLVAMLMTLVPIVTIVFLFELFIDVIWLWHGMLLWLALDWFNVSQQSNKICHALKNEQNAKAKIMLAPWVLRDTSTLSALGIQKANIETLLLRFHHDLFNLIIIFLIFGPLATFTCRLCLEMQRTWNTKLIQFQHFGKPVHLMMNWIQWPTARLLGFVILLLSAGKNTTLFIRLTSKQFWQSSPHYLLHCFALANGIKLGGAIIYLKQKQRRIVINDVGRQPERIDVLKINVFLKSFIIAMTLGFIVIIMLQWLSQSTNLH